MNPFARILVFSPLPKNPLSPLMAITTQAAAVYLIHILLAWRYVLRVQRELEVVSEMTEAMNLIKTHLPSFWRALWGRR